MHATTDKLTDESISLVYVAQGPLPLLSVATPVGNH